MVLYHLKRHTMSGCPTMIETRIGHFGKGRPLLYYHFNFILTGWIFERKRNTLKVFTSHKKRGWLQATMFSRENLFVKMKFLTRTPLNIPNSGVGYGRGTQLICTRLQVIE